MRRALSGVLVGVGIGIIMTLVNVLLWLVDSPWRYGWYHV